MRYGHLSIPAGFSRHSVRRFAPPLAVQLGFSSPLPSPRLRPRRLNVGGHGILNRVCITYALRPRLSSRLTLGGRTYPRKPWTFGGPDFHRPYRYSCLHSHFWILHVQLPSCFTGSRTLPYHSPPCGGSPKLRYTVYRQSFSAQNRSMSQLLRTV